MLIWEEDPIFSELKYIDITVVLVPFNPTAENMAKYLVEEIGPIQLQGSGTKLTQVMVEETAKCFATYIKE